MDKAAIKKPNLDLANIFIAVTLGILAAVGLYQAQIRGLLPFGGFKIPAVVNTETRTLVQEEDAVISAVEKASSSVVAIGISTKVINPFNPFAPSRSQDNTIGTGFVISDKAIIVTNKHVVSGAGPYTVITKDGQKYEVTRVYRDPILDLAFVQINAQGLKAVELGDSSKLKVGQTVIAIGNALGRFTNSVTTGVVSGLGRKVVAGDPFSGATESLDNLIQTDAAINPGNSGGPLLNSKGQVIGVNVATTEGAQNIGFAIPMNTVKPIMEEFLQKGSVSRPFLGVQYKFISRDVALLNDVPQGVYVQDVVLGGPAEKAGVKSGDIITKINNQAIDNESKLAEIVAGSNIGAKLELTVYRDGREIKVTATLSDLPAQ
ncbi:MAG: trypsin-like peptidase domain-containing protein [Candidatus Daviesbacteria bacterium]|nr:MAG: trypsin-like peptidase domain-containing protein [Candidatus Daviesbacteria bacterium]